MTSETAPVFVTGATGRHGATGATVARELLARGVPVRALVRADDDRADTLRAAGAEVVVGDLHDQRSYVDALAGVRSAYFTYPVRAGAVDAAANFAAAARAANLPKVVIMSAVIARLDHPSPFARAQRLAEDVLSWAGVPCLSLRIVGFFLENLPLLHRADVMRDGLLRSTFSDMPLPWIAGDDAGKLAVAALLDPQAFGDDAVVYPAGTQLLSQSDIARELGRHIGRAVRTDTIPKEEWRERLRALSLEDDRITEFMAEHIAETAALISRGGRPPQVKLYDFEAVTGAKPLSLSEALAAGTLHFA